LTTQLDLAKVPFFAASIPEDGQQNQNQDRHKYHYNGDFHQHQKEANKSYKLFQ
jgi:hypothetical protein